MGIRHIFDIEIAEELDIKQAILIENFSNWISHSRSTKDNFHDGRYWVCNSLSVLEEMIPYMSTSTIRITIKKLVDNGVLLKGNFNKCKLYRTTWYAFTDKWVNILGLGE